MEPLERIREHFNPRGEAESSWLQNMLSFVTDQLLPVVSSPGVCAAQLSVCVVRSIQDKMCVSHSLPVSYRPVCVSELVSLQRVPCVSNLSWSTNQHRAWAREAGPTALPRVNLLLIGCLRRGRGQDWRLTDASGSVTCECLSPSPLWLDRPVFLPHWNYIPHNASGQEAGGCLELIGSPVLLCPDAAQGLAVCPDAAQGLAVRALGAGFRGVVTVREAAALLMNRTRGQRVCVRGQVGSVCPLLLVSGTTFFIFSLTDGGDSLPVLVKESSRLWWAQCVCVGQSVCVTALRVCVLRGWRGNNILCATDQSDVHTNYTHTQTQTHTQTHTEGQTHTQTHTHTQSQTHTQTHTQGQTEGQTHTQEHTQTHTHTVTQPPVMMSQDDQCEEEEPERDVGQSGVRMKQSRVISYQGTVTEVVSEGAGLYVIDRRVGLCLAYQPALSRKLRAGDRVELHHVHFLYRPCPDFPPSMLCTCLRSSVRLTAFSRQTDGQTDRQRGGACRCPDDAVLPRLLLEKNVGVSEYLWTCHLTKQLRESLACVKQQCVCVLSWKLMERVLSRGRGGRRDIYCEMLDHPHTCPLTQYRVDPAMPQFISLSELSVSLNAHSAAPLSSLLPPGGGSGLTAAQINSALSWTYKTLYSDSHTGDRQLLLVGVFEASDQTLKLRDNTAAMSCVATETEEGGQRALCNTAWIGCLVCVQHFTMVTERFIQSDFPSYQHLDQEQYITHTHCRVYLQFSLDRVHILSPSVAMATHLRHRGVEPNHKEEELDPVNQIWEGPNHKGEETGAHKRKREHEEKSSHSRPAVTTTTVSSQQCVSTVEPVCQKEVGPNHKEVGPNHKEVGPNHKEVGPNHKEVGPNHKEVGPNHKEVGPNHKEVGLIHKGEETDDRKRKREEDNSSHSRPGAPQTDVSSRPCVSMVIRVEQKEGVAYTNTGAETKEKEAGLTASFTVRAAVIGPVVLWGRDPKNQAMTDRETDTERSDKVLLLFSGVSSRWFPLLQPGCFYRLIAANTQDPSSLVGRGVAGRSGVELHADVTLQVRSDWRIHTLSRPFLLQRYTQALSPALLSVSEVLDCSSELVSFQAMVSERISLNDRTNDSGHKHTGVRLTVCDQTGRSLQVYLDLSHTPYPHGLLPGNTLLLSAFQRKMSRTGSVYCRYLPVSSVTVVSLGDSSPAPPPLPPMVHLGEWAAGSEPRCIVGRVRCHVVCFLMLNLQWSCSLCGAVYKQSCSSSQCVSTSSVFQSQAKLVVDDGTGEAHLWLSGDQLPALLGLAAAQWEGLQRALRVKGHIRVYPRGHSTVCDSDDPLIHFLSCVCSSDVVCRSLSLTCRKQTSHRTEEMKRFSRGERDFMTTMTRPLQLTCLQLHTV